MKKLIVLILASVMLTGCAINLPFNNRLSYDALKALQQQIPVTGEKVTIFWQPENFPERIDVHGASGFVGGGSRTRIPTGVALASRIEEAISVYASIVPNGKKLTITIDNAQSKFKYSAGIFNVTPAIDVADVVFKADFDLDGIKWTNEYTSKLKDPTIGGSSETGLLEKAWDNIAVQVAQDVARHMQ